MPATRDSPSVREREYLLVVLLGVLAFNLVDRQALGLVVQEIKGDFGFSDTQLGLLNGIAFSLFYSTMGIPIARWADRGNRVTIIAAATALWSAAVALCGFAANFVQLLLCRVLTGVGESGCLPPAHSLIADYFDRGERPRAVARFMLGGPLSFIVGFFFAGWLNEEYGWRVMFLFLGAPGIVLAGIVHFTLREPRLRRDRDASTSSAPPQALPRVGIEQVYRELRDNATFRYLLLNFSVTAFFNYGIAQWQPAFFVRSFGLKTGEIGTWFAVIWGLGGLLGTYLGGELASRRAANQERLQLQAISMVIACCAPLSMLIYLSPNKYMAFAALGVIAIGGSSISGPLFATIQSVIPNRMRAISIATIFLFANLIGLGLGPLMAGALSDALRHRFESESLRYALLAMCPGYLWGAWYLWRASATVARDLEVARSADRAPEQVSKEAHA